jgi:hypothetical protein
VWFLGKRHKNKHIPLLFQQFDFGRV